MVRHCRERNDHAGLTFWRYVLQVLDALGHDGMSDEEGTEIDVNNQGFVRKHPAKKILVLYWRHPWFRDLFQRVDSAPAVEKLIFRRSRSSRMPRIAVSQQSQRPPPKGLPVTFFRPQYLESLLAVDKEDLQISDKRVEVFNF
ncbi:hypothetical protein FB446DRAFT_607317, partial [Lentinula raphanica]